MLDHLFHSQEDQKGKRIIKGEQQQKNGIGVLLVVDILQIGINCNNTCN